PKAPCRFRRMVRFLQRPRRSALSLDYKYGVAGTSPFREPVHQAKAYAPSSATRPRGIRESKNHKNFSLETGPIGPPSHFCPPLLARQRDRMMCAAMPILGPPGIRNENLLTRRG